MHKPLNPQARLPHHRLIAYSVTKELLIAVCSAEIGDAELRDQARRAAKGAALNTAEAASRVSPRDRQRVFGIARGEAAEAAAAIEIAFLMGVVSERTHLQVQALATRACALLTGLCR